MTSIMQRLLPFALGVVVSACYTQLPLQTIPPPPTTHISALLTDSGTVMMGNALGPGVISVEGIVETADQRNWSLHMVSVDQKDGRTIPWNRELVTFPS